MVYAAFLECVQSVGTALLGGTSWAAPYRVRSGCASGGQGTLSHQVRRNVHVEVLQRKSVSSDPTSFSTSYAPCRRWQGASYRSCRARELTRRAVAHPRESGCGSPNPWPRLRRRLCGKCDVRDGTRACNNQPRPPSLPIPGHTIFLSCSKPNSDAIEPSWATLCQYFLGLPARRASMCARSCLRKTPYLSAE